MKNMIRKIFTLCMGLLATGLVTAQTNFADFKITAKDGESRKLSGVTIRMILNDIEVASDTTDSDGNAEFTTLNPGTYDVSATKEGYPDQRLNGISLGPGYNNTEEIVFVKSDGKMTDVIIRVKGKRTPVDMMKSEAVIDQKQILNSGRRGTSLLVGTNSAIMSTPQGISVRGTRADGNGTYVDGVRQIGSGGLPTLGTEQISANVGGIPAMYGDLTGGVFSSTSKSATDKIVTAVEAQTSTGLDAFGHNTVEGFISGPLIVKDVKDAETGKKRRMVKLGYVLNGNVGYYKDPNPTRTGVYVVNDQKLQEIENNPLVYTPNGFVSTASYLRESDFNQLKARPNSPLSNGNFIGKLEWRPSQGVSVVGYASYFYQQNLAGSNSVMNFKNNGRGDNQTFRGYLLFTQNFKTNKESSIKNAYYSIRAEYQNSYNEGRDAVHMDNIFNYGYIGKFKSYPTAVFAYSNNDPQQNPNREPKIMRDQFGNYVQLRNYWEQVGNTDTLMTYTASELNPVRAKYTQSIYDYYNGRGFNINGINTLLASQGLVNGMNPNAVYSLHNTPGGNTSGWTKNSAERYGLFAVGQMSVKGKTVGGRERTQHDLQAGFYYEQQINRGYGLGANGLWILMRQLMNKHITELDLSNPILSYDANGQFTDTVRYNRLINYGEQSQFDRNFRDKLIQDGATDVYGNKIDERTFVDVNSFAPSDFKLDMFNADELLNNGNSYVNYFGYDYLGNRVAGKPSIEQFLNNKTQRTIGAFQPVYIAAWLQDQFQFKDLVFRLGLRMERYDANQLVLKDPYTLYPIKTKGEVKQINGLDILHPNNIGDDFKVYVNDIDAPTKIIGYRDGDKWFNADGSELRSAEFLANQTSNGRIAPYLVNPNKQELTKDALEDFLPAVNLLPRIWFSFPLEPGRKSFYVSYDVLAQRPNSGASFLTIDELYYLKNRQGSTISNGSLKPRIKTDYEVGYKQIMGKKKDRGLEIAASYSENRKDFGLYQISQGYPVTYTTYRNIDFSTVTGFRGTYVMNDIGGKGNMPGPFSLVASYMMQFADGTGSNINSQAALIASNQPNLRNVIPLGELDIRHNVKFSATWAWGGGINPITKKNMYNGPRWKGKEIFKYASFNVISNSYSGTPYTPTINPVQIGAVDRSRIKGVPFGARLPWNQTFDINITKGLRFNREDKVQPLLMNVFFIISNVLNAYNVVSVYPYTGQPLDDGFINSPQGQLLAKNQIDAQSYVDLYKILLNSQTGNLGAPRTIKVGLRINFN